MILIKIVLAILSGMLCARAVQKEDGKLALYWEIVLFYWVLNALDQLI